MSIQSEIDRISANISGAYSAVADMGGTLPENQVSNNLEEAIRSIPTGGGKEWQLLLNKTLDEDSAIDTGSMPDMTEMLFLYAAPPTDPVISSGTITKAFGGWAPYYGNLTHATYPTSGMIYGMRMGNSAISFHRFHQTSTIGIGKPPRTAGVLQCSQTEAATDVPFTSPALPAGTIIKLYVR